ncbi:MAG: hydrogenase maturation nickel metallochaperone HypA [Candidatus Neomarinimicrobiota bacterium]
MSLAINIVDIACRTAKQNGAESIRSIEVEIGQLAGVLTDSLCFCFEAARANTFARDSKLDIITVKGRGHCRTCDHAFETNSFFKLCPICSGLAVDIVAGKELKIKAINVD